MVNIYVIFFKKITQNNKYDIVAMLQMYEDMDLLSSNI